MKFIAGRDEGDPVIATHRYYFSWIKPFIKNKKVLDIGCWTGPMEQLLSKVDCDVTATDIEEKPLKVARKRFPKMRFVRESIVEGSSFQNNEFDVVLFFMVIEHITPGSELAALRNINKIMKKGGYLFLTTMNGNFFSKLTDPAYFMVGHRHYSKKHLAELLDLAGFKVKETRINGGFGNITYAFLLYFFKHILRRAEPKGGIVDRLLARDYNSKGFTEIDIRAQKVKDVF